MDVSRQAPLDNQEVHSWQSLGESKLQFRGEPLF